MYDNDRKGNIYPAVPIELRDPDGDAELVPQLLHPVLEPCRVHPEQMK